MGNSGCILTSLLHGLSLFPQRVAVEVIYKFSVNLRAWVPSLTFPRSHIAYFWAGKIHNLCQWYHTVYSQGGPTCAKLAKDAVQRLRGGKNVCSFLCCHIHASGPTPHLLIPQQRQSNILLTILQGCSYKQCKCKCIYRNDKIQMLQCRY